MTHPYLAFLAFQALQDIQLLQVFQFQADRADQKAPEGPLDLGHQVLLEYHGQVLLSGLAVQEFQDDLLSQVLHVGLLLLEDHVVQAFQEKRGQQVQGFQVILALLLHLEVLQVLDVPSRLEIQVILVFQVNLGFQVYQVRSILLDLVVQVDPSDQ